VGESPPDNHSEAAVAMRRTFSRTAFAVAGSRGRFHVRDLMGRRLAMTDAELVAGFEAATLPAASFSHVEHVRVAWWYLTQHPFPEALARFCEALRRFAAANGAVDRYHETITVAYVLLIAERLETMRGQPWPAFAAAHPELLVWKPSLLAQYYTEELLQSPRARRVFVMPDRTPAPVGAPPIGSPTRADQ
jgi:hypothetical protein